MKDYSYFLTCLKKLVSFPSVRGEREENMPFGKPVYLALDYFLSLARDMGFQCINYDNYAGEIVYGDGEEIGVIGHLDVVPAGNGWATDPFELTKVGDYYFARGIMDDKAPLLACLFALKELKDSKIKPNRKFRLIVGCNEESGWEDVEYVKSKTSFPEYGFSPDGNFPVSYAEKGVAIVTFSLPLPKKFTGTVGGTVINAVCDRITCKPRFAVKEEDLKKFGLLLTDGGEILSQGKSAHGSKPELGKNAILPLLKYMVSEGENYQRAIDCLFGEENTLSKLTSEQGSVTLSPNLIKQTESELLISCDLRFPYPVTMLEIVNLLDNFGLKYTYQVKHPTQYVDKNGEMVTSLLSVYNSVMGVNEKPQSQSGSTFARAFEKGVAFGPEFPGENTRIHEPNENVSETSLKKMYEIYKNAIFSLCNAKNI